MMKIIAAKGIATSTQAKIVSSLFFIVLFFREW